MNTQVWQQEVERFELDARMDLGGGVGSQHILVKVHCFGEVYEFASGNLVATLGTVPEQLADLFTEVAEAVRRGA
jgi:hypothetical protein